MNGVLEPMPSELLSKTYAHLVLCFGAMFLGYYNIVNSGDEGPF